MAAPISLAVFTTTKGHFDFTNIYKTAISDLLLQTGPHFFAEKVVHIKTEVGHDTVKGEMVDFFRGQGFKVLMTEGQWKHYSQSHYIEHAKDIVTLMSDPTVQRNPYVFWLEDDFLLRTVDGDLLRAFQSAQKLLESDPNILNVRFLKNKADTELLQASNLKDITGNIFFHNDVYSFNPNLVRSRDVWLMARLFERHFFNNLHVHIERAATEFLKNLPSRGESIFSAFELGYAKAVHIGEKTFYPGMNKDVKFS